MTRRSKSTWQQMRLNEICSKGKSTLRQKDLPNDGRYPVYGASGVVGGMTEYQNAIPYVAIVKDGAGVGRVYACEAKSSVLGTMQALIPNERTERDYLFHLLRSLKLGEGFSGSTIPHIYFKDYGKRVVPFPDLAEQRDIAKQLNFIDSGISRAQVQIGKLDALVKSRFMEQFGNPITNDRGWDHVLLSELAEFVLGGTPKSNEPEYWDGNIKWITPAELKDTSFVIYDSVRHITEAGVKAAGLKPFPAGTVIFSTRAPIGKTAIAGCEMFCNQGFKNFICGPRLNPVYLFSVLRIHKAYFIGLGAGATFKELSKARLEKIAISVPPMELQERFEEFYRQVDKSKSIAQKQIDKLQMLYDSLAQEYFGD